MLNILTVFKIWLSDNKKIVFEYDNEWVKKVQAAVFFALFFYYLVIDFHLVV